MNPSDTRFTLTMRFKPTVQFKPTGQGHPHGAGLFDTMRENSDRKKPMELALQGKKKAAQRKYKKM
ncbi:MAG: hypothetical protein Q4C48_03450 [Lachnospiraceae bacterium]|nr:hypothetical protein [Lachnospiraceae bacterium]